MKSYTTIVQVTDITSLSFKVFISLLDSLNQSNLETCPILQQSCFKMFSVNFLVLNCLFQMILSDAPLSSDDLPRKASGLEGLRNMLARTPFMNMKLKATNLNIRCTWTYKTPKIFMFHSKKNKTNKNKQAKLLSSYHD